MNLILYALVLFIILWVLISSARNKVLRQIGFRNILRRKSTTLLIIFGSLIGTALIAGSLTLGDSFSKSTQIKAEKFLGEIDAQITLKNSSSDSSYSSSKPSGNPLSGIFNKSESNKIISSFDTSHIDGTINALDFSTSLTSTNGLSVTGSDLVAFENSQFASENIDFTIPYGDTVISQDIATRLDLKIGDMIRSYNGIKDLNLKVMGINTNKGASAYSLGNGNILVSPSYLAHEFKLPDNSFNKLFVSAKGGVFESTYNPSEFTQYLENKIQTIEQNQWNVTELKSQYTTGGIQFISYAFLVVSLAGVVAGILLLINIYSMLAQERKSEMGTLRAIALTRRNLIKTFLYEGFVYSIASSFLGVIGGIGIGFLLLTAVINLANSVNPNLGIVFDSEPSTWLVSFCIGILITFFTSLFACYRISKINIVSAIRGISDDKDIKKTTWSIIKVIIQVLILISAIQSIVGGIILLIIPKEKLQQLDSVIPVDAIAGYSIFAGVFLTCYILSILIGKYLARQGKEKNQRWTITILNLPPLLLACFIDKIPLFNKVFTTSLGPTLLLFAGLTIVFTTTIIISYNLEVIIWLLVKTIGKIGRSSTIMKLALRYSSENRFRTSLTILMFSLILFLVSFLSVYRATIDKQFETFAPKSGYDAFVKAPVTVDPAIVVKDVEKLGITTDISVNKSGFISYKDITFNDLYPNAGKSLLGNKSDQRVPITLFGYDQNFIKNNPIKLSEHTSGYASDSDAVAQTLINPSKIILSPSFAGPNGKPIDKLKVGNTVLIMVGDQVMSEEIIGLLDINSPQNYTLFQYGILTGNKFFDTLPATTLTTLNYTNDIAFKLKDSVTSKSAAIKDIQKVLILYNLADGLFSISQVFDLISNILRGAIIILQGFLSFALFVGISGIAIIMIRSVNERRQQIGMLRAIGFRRSHILLIFFIEASFIIFLGIVIGIFSGALSANIFIHAINSSSNGSRAVIITTPYSEFILIAIGVYIVSIIFTLIPSYQASKLSPVESTNYLD